MSPALLANPWIALALLTMAPDSAQQAPPQIQTIRVTLGTEDPLPAGAEVTFVVHLSRGHQSLPKPEGQGRVGLSRQELATEEIAPETARVTCKADSAGRFNPSQSIFTFPAPMTLESGKLSVLLVEASVTITVDHQVVLQQASDFPIILRSAGMDSDPICLSTTYRATPGGQKVFGLARHACGAPVDFTKAIAIPKH